MKKLKVFIDWASQPSRSVVAFCRLAQIEHQLVELRIIKKQHKTAEMLEINPLG